MLSVDVKFLCTTQTIKHHFILIIRLSGPDNRMFRLLTLKTSINLYNLFLQLFIHHISANSTIDTKLAISFKLSNRRTTKTCQMQFSFFPGSHAQKANPLFVSLFINWGNHFGYSVLIVLKILVAVVITGVVCFLEHTLATTYLRLFGSRLYCMIY